MDIKEIVKNTIKLVFVEVCYGLILSLVNLGKNVVNTIIAQGAATSEIQRLKGETSLVVTETLMNYNNSINLVATGFTFIVIILMLYAVYKYVKKTFLNKEGEK